MKTKPLWTALLLPQFALLLYSLWADCRIIGYQLRHGEQFPIGCFSIGIADVTPTAVIGTLGIVSLLGLLGFRPWARWSYLAFVTILLAVLYFLLPLTDWLSIVLVGGLYLLAIITAFLCFSRALRHQFRTNVA